MIKEYGDDGNVYRIVMYNMGSVLEETGDMTLDEARKYYVNNYSYNCAMKLFMNGEAVAYINVKKVLKLRNNELYERQKRKN